MGLSVLEAANTGIKYLDSDKILGWIYLPYSESFISYTPSPSLALNPEELSFLLTPFDLKRLESYAQNSLDYHVILDLLPTVALLFFEKRLGNEVRLSVIQSSILLGMGLQRKSVEEVEVRDRLILLSDPGLSAHTLTRRRSSSCPFPRRLRYSRS
jgi:N-acetyltransferase 10